MLRTGAKLSVHKITAPNYHQTFDIPLKQNRFVLRELMKKNGSGALLPNKAG